jgi:hypothetical protein
MAGIQVSSFSTRVGAIPYRSHLLDLMVIALSAGVRVVMRGAPGTGRSQADRWLCVQPLLNQQTGQDLPVRAFIKTSATGEGKRTGGREPWLPLRGERSEVCLAAPLAQSTARVDSQDISYFPAGAAVATSNLGNTPVGFGSPVPGRNLCSGVTNAKLLHSGATASWSSNRVAELGTIGWYRMAMTRRASAMTYSTVAIRTGSVFLRFHGAVSSRYLLQAFTAWCQIRFMKLSG